MEIKIEKSLPLLLLSIVIFFVGVFGGYFVWGQEIDAVQAAVVESAAAVEQTSNQGGSEFDVADLVMQINPPEGVDLGVTFGDIGPALVAAGAIDVDQFAAIYAQSGQALTAEQKTVLLDGGDIPLVINKQNAYFLLNFFWAFGLTNSNPILLQGPMMQNGADQVGRFASTGGWTVGTLPATSLYASQEIITLSAEQQQRLEQAASMVFRPCCNNPTIFPDCNHGMAMLGIFELMAGQGATVEEMLMAAKYVNAFWFPEQTFQVAVFHQINNGVSFTELDPKVAVGPDFMSGSGYNQLQTWLASRGLLEGGGGGASCGV